MKNKGFSLIECVIVIALIGILATFSYPAYQNALVRARRTDGQTALLQLALRMEQYYQQQQSYQRATVEILGSAYSPEHWYQLNLISQSDEDFALTATPLGAQAKYDSLCPLLRLNSAGLRAPLSCW
ncbi:MAG: type IV pilin protein [Tatlockia sp.]|jgi:type IV pilus assembly protein PilE